MVYKQLLILKEKQWKKYCDPSSYQYNPDLMPNYPNALGNIVIPEDKVADYMQYEAKYFIGSYESVKAILTAHCNTHFTESSTPSDWYKLEVDAKTRLQWVKYGSGSSPKYAVFSLAPLLQPTGKTLVGEKDRLREEFIRYLEKLPASTPNKYADLW